MQRPNEFCPFGISINAVLAVLALLYTFRESYARKNYKLLNTQVLCVHHRAMELKRAEKKQVREETREKCVL